MFIKKLIASIFKREPFDANFYLQHNPDVARANISPYQHYIRHGKSEGRLGTPPKIDIKYNTPLDPSRENILLVSHEASRTGAPILALNIAQGLKKKYNIIVILLAEGCILDEFERASHILVCSKKENEYLLLQQIIKELLSQYKITYALVNSIVSHLSIPILAKNYIPSVALIHEFASYTPANYMSSAILWASSTVFSANIIRDNAILMCKKTMPWSPNLNNHLSIVIPQGKCKLPINISPSLIQQEKKMISAIPTTSNWPQNSIIILGAGTVQYRKGVDIFISCAAQILAQQPQCQFIWVGHGYDPIHEKGYSVYLAEQLERSGLTSNFTFIEEVADLEPVYKIADILFLSSRLDPLPNVGIDAMIFGLPIVCFDKASGIADILKENGLGKFCVADYMDYFSAVALLSQFIQSTKHRKQIGNQLQKIALNLFDLPLYIKKIDSLALSKINCLQQEYSDLCYILNSNEFRFDFFRSQQATKLEDKEMIQQFLRSWSTGMNCRKPCPGFHPGIYLEQNLNFMEKKNPFVHFLESGRPSGPWKIQVISPLQEIFKKRTLHKVALHIQINSLNLGMKIINKLKVNTTFPDLFISVSKAAEQDQLSRYLKTYPGKIIDIQAIPEHENNIDVFLTLLSKKMADYYDIVGYIHTQSSWSKTSSLSQDGFDYIIDNLIGNTYPMIDIILNQMSKDPYLGLVFPDDPCIYSWMEYDYEAQILSEKLQLDYMHYQYIDFPSDIMFWVKTDAIKSLTERNWKDNPKKSKPDSVLEVIKRLIPTIVKDSGFRYAVTNIPGISR